MRTPDGRPINAAHGFINMLARLIADRDPVFLACATDEDWRPSWRVDLLESYKTHRLGLPETDLDPQIPIAFEVLRACGVSVIGCRDYEAEDVIGVLAARAPGKVEIVSGDRDLFQLVRDPVVTVLYPRKGVADLQLVNEAYIAAKYQIPGRAYGDFALLRGDPSDGLPGVPGIGEKTAASLITKHGSLERVIEAAILDGTNGPLAKVRRSLDYLDKAVQVVLISDEAPIGECELKRPTGDIDPAVIELADSYGLAGAVRRLGAALGAPASGPTAGPISGPQLDQAR